MANGRHRIGDWEFDPASAELVRAEERKRIEDRAARTLELLCRRRGEVVSQEEIVAEIWGGRQQSPNSVAVVISDLRRALGDDARNPRHIETVAKRGYRLSDDGAAAALAGAKRPGSAVAIVVVLAGLAMLVGIAWLMFARHDPRVVVRATEVRNETGSRAYTPLAQAVDTLLVTDLRAARGVALIRAGKTRADIELSTRLILWSGRPTIMFSAEDRKTHVVVWSGMANGPEDEMPRTVKDELKEFTAKVVNAETR